MKHNRQMPDESLENIKVLLNPKLGKPVKSLTSAQSKACYHTLISNKNLNKTSDEYEKLLANYILLCDEKYLCKTVIPDSRFWAILCDNCQKLRSETLVANLIRIFNVALKCQDSNKNEVIVSICHISRETLSSLEYFYNFCPKDLFIYRCLRTLYYA